MGKELLGKSSRAEEIVTNKDVDKTPGKTNNVDGVDALSQNLLTPEERTDKITNLKHRITAAGARCNDAIQAVKIYTILKKPDDMPWVFGLLLDVCVTSLTTNAIRALTKFKTGKIAEYGKAAADAAAHQDIAAHDAAEKRRKVFAYVSDETIKARIGLVGGFAKSGAKGIVAMTLADSQEKGETLSYLAQLQKSMDKAFQNLGENGTKNLSDPELEVLYAAMDSDNHSSEFYERAITEKIARYKNSGVEQLGKHQDPLGIADPERHYESIGSINSDKQVAWAEYPDGSKCLYFYEMAESTTNARSHELAMAKGMDGQFRLTVPVSPEFWDEAIARHEKLTGEKVRTFGNSPWTRKQLGLPEDHKTNMDAARVPPAAGKGTIRSATNRIFGGK